MPRNYEYYFDYQEHGHRKRLWIRPANGSERVVFGWPSYSGVITPDWGEESNGSWKQCPAGWLKPDSTIGQAGYDGLPIGLFDTPTRSFRVDLSLLNDDFDLRDLARYIISPVVESQEVRLNSNESAYASDFFDALNLYIVLTDAGDSEAAIGDFEVEYIGVQYRNLKNKLDISQETGETLIDIDTLHVVRAVLTELKPEHLQTNMYLEVQDEASGYEERQTTVMIDTVWWDTGYRWERRLGNPGDDPHQVFCWYRMQDLWQSLHFLCSQLLEMYTGLPGITMSFATPDGFPEDVGAMTMWELRQQTGGISGTAQTTGLLSARDAWFLGDVQYSDNLGSSTSHIGGYLHPNETNAGLWKYSCLWDWLKALTEQCCARALLQQTYFGALTLSFIPLDSSESSSIERSDLKPAGDRLEPVLWDEIISGAESDPVGSVDGDYDKGARYSVWGTGEDNRRPVPCVFQNLPSVGNIDNRDWDSDETLTYGQTTDVPVNIVVYFSDVNEIYETEQAVRVHHYVGIRTNSGVQYDTMNGPTTDYPTPEPVDDEVAWENEFWFPWRLLALEIQRRGGLSYAATAFIAKRFSKWTQWTLETRVSYELALLRHVGTRVTLNPADFLQAGDFFDDLPSDPIIMQISPDGGETTIKVMGVE